DVGAWSASARTHTRLSRIGFVFQTQNLLDHLTTRENIALPSWRAGGSRAAALRAADKLLERFGLAERAGTRAAHLSTGEAQRATPSPPARWSTVRGSCPPTSRPAASTPRIRRSCSMRWPRSRHRGPRSSSRHTIQQLPLVAARLPCATADSALPRVICLRRN